MAMNVTFKKGKAASLPQVRDEFTFYYVDDTFALYLGDHLISNEVTDAQFGALEKRVKSLEDADFQGQINAIQESLKSIASNETVKDINDRLAAVEGDYLKAADKTELETAIGKKVDQTAYNTRVEAIETAATALTSRVDTAESEIDDLQTRITGLTGAMHFKGAVSALPSGDALKDYVSGDVIIVTNTDKEYVYDGANWLELGAEGSHALKTVKISGTGYLAGGGDLSEDRAIDISDEVKNKIDNGATAYGWGNHAEVGYLTEHQDISGKADKTDIADMLTQTSAAETYQPKGNYEEAGAAAAVQGGTTNTVEDCVNAINKMNSLTGETIGTVENIVAQLTWGAF